MLVKMSKICTIPIFQIQNYTFLMIKSIDLATVIN